MLHIMYSFKRIISHKIRIRLRLFIVVATGWQCIYKRFPLNLLNVIFAHNNLIISY